MEETAPTGHERARAEHFGVLLWCFGTQFVPMKARRSPVCPNTSTLGLYAVQSLAKSLFFPPRGDRPPGVEQRESDTK